MYVKLVFQFTKWIVPGCGGGLYAFLASKPEIVSELPSGIKANGYSKKQDTFLTKNPVNATYYQNCESLSEKQITKALSSFAEHYDNYANGNLPGTELAVFDPKQNEIISNLRIAIDNLLNEQNEPFLSVNSSGNGQDTLERNFC